ncbi:uncharacterized protein TNCV_2909131 [Trichonephila clavipes]|nr:uncharacterized protein TNCV_2909131 [Trichonephila clavipes]
MGFIHEGVQTHISIVVGNHQHATYLGEWIRRGGPVSWPPRFPNVNPLDFFFWSNLKSVEYETLVTSLEDLTARIVVASADITHTHTIYLNVSDNPSSVGVSFALTYAVET